MKTSLSSLLLRASLLGGAALTPLLASFQAPRPITQAEPRYAFELRRDDVEGAVVIVFTITETGAVRSASVLSSTDRIFEAPSLEAIARWTYRPALRDGKAVSVPAMQLITYTVPWKVPATTTASLVANLRLKPDADALLASNSRILPALKGLASSDRAEAEMVSDD